MIRCPWCLTDSMRPDLITTGLHLICTHCRATVTPPAKELRKQCGTCGRKRCPWAQYGPADCQRWRPIPRPELWVDEDIFEGAGG